MVHTVDGCTGYMYITQMNPVQDTCIPAVYQVQDLQGIMFDDVVKYSADTRQQPDS